MFDWLMEMFRWGETTKVWEESPQPLEIEVELSPTEYIEEIQIIPSYDWKDDFYE